MRDLALVAGGFFMALFLVFVMHSMGTTTTTTANTTTQPSYQPSSNSSNCVSYDGNYSNDHC